jgi:hypothetical protein
MADEPAKPVSGVLTRRTQDGRTEEIRLTAEELEHATEHYEPADLERIVVTMSDGEVVRPWRFVSTAPEISVEIDTDTGLRTGRIFF